MVGKALPCFFLVLFSGCLGSSSHDQETARQFRRIWLAMDNYSQLEKRLPPQNNSPWRHAAATGLEVVPWRGLLLDHLAAIGTRSEEQDALPTVSEQVELVARHSYYVDSARLIQSNLGQVRDGDTLDDLPQFIVLAYTGPEDRSWQSPEESSVESLLAMGKQWHRPGYLLFANGSVGKYAELDLSDVKRLLTRDLAAQLNQQRLQDMGIEFLLDES